MALPVFPADAAAFLDGLNNDPYDPVTNPKGLDNGGHIVIWPEGNEAISILANYFSALGDALQAMATQVAADADAAEQGSGTEASAVEIRGGAGAHYTSIRRIYAANDPVALTDAASIAWDMSAGINFKVTLGAAGRTLANPSNQVAGKSGIIIFTQNGSGTGTITSYGANIVWIGGQPDWPTTPGAKVVVAYFVEANGTVLMSPSGASA